MYYYVAAVFSIARFCKFCPSKVRTLVTFIVCQIWKICLEKQQISRFEKTLRDFEKKDFKFLKDLIPLQS